MQDVYLGIVVLFFYVFTFMMFWLARCKSARLQAELKLIKRKPIVPTSLFPIHIHHHSRT